MRYWLFYIMDWVIRSGGWKKQADLGIAAQDYPTPDYPGADQNIPLLMEIKRGDWLVAGRACRFAGYGKATSDFYQGGRSLAICHPDWPDEPAEFYERVNVKWHLVPGYGDQKDWLDLHDLKDELLERSARTGRSSRWSEIYFIPGRCVKEISAQLFRKIRRRLDEKGAAPVGARPIVRRAKRRNIVPTYWDELLEEQPKRPSRRSFLVTRPVRDPRNRLAAKERADWKCEVPRCSVRTFLQRDTRHPYVEAHHLEPIGKKGIEHLSNIAVVCAWHHALLTHGPEEEAQKLAGQLKAVRRAEKARG